MKQLCDRHVCFIAGTLGQGGAERQLYYMLRVLQSSGARARLLTFTRGEFWENKIRELGIEVTFAGRTQGRLRRLRTIVSVLRREQPDFIQSQHFFANTYAAIAGRLTQVADIGAIRCDAANEVLNGGPILGRLHLRLPRAIIANSRAAIENAVRRSVPPQRLHFLANVVDTEEFAPNPDRTASEGRPLRLLAVGRLIRRKRHDMLLRAAAELRRRWGPVEVTIAGSGVLEQELRTLTADLEMRGHVKFTGAVESRAVARLYAESDVFVLPSDYEGTPNVLLEAMSSGLPVIATRVSGNPAIVQDGVSGVLVEPGNTDQLSIALQTLAENPFRRRQLGTAARDHIVSHYSVRSLAGALEDVYNAAAG